MSILRTAESRFIYRTAFNALLVLPECRHFRPTFLSDHLANVPLGAVPPNSEVSVADPSVAA